MKKWIVAAGLTTTIFVTAACGSEKVNGQGPSNIPVEWVNAHIQKDQGKMAELLEKEQSLIDPEDKADNDSQVENYKLTEWKVDDDRYFYEIVYEHPEEGRLKTVKMEVIQTYDGWKRSKYGEINDFDQLVANIEPKVLKELHNQ